jgi:hypothetical protein
LSLELKIASLQDALRSIKTISRIPHLREALSATKQS